MNMEDFATWEIMGALARKYIAPSGKFCVFTVETKKEGRKTLHNIKSFENAVCVDLDQLGIGEMVEVSGEIACMVLKGRDKTEIKVDERVYWETTLKALKVEPAHVRGAAVKEAAKNEPKNDPMADDDIPF